MTTVQSSQNLYDRIAALKDALTGQLAGDLAANPQLGEELNRQLDELLAATLNAQLGPLPPDRGLAELVGLGPEAGAKLGATQLPRGVEPYDEEVTSERVLAIGDLYYIYQHEKIGVFRVIHKLQDLFRAGAVRLSSGPGAYALYQFDRREVLRYTQRDRLA